MPRTRVSSPSRATRTNGTTPASPPPVATEAIGAGDSLTHFEIEGLRYELDRPPSKQGRRSVATVRLAELPGDPGFTDRVDLFAFRSRHSFAVRVADSFGRQAGQVMGHLAVILDAVERARAAEPQQVEELTPLRRAAAAELLGQPDLLERAAAVMDTLGYVGEENTKRMAFLVATSRLLPKPLSAILMAPSGCGKSELLEVVAKLLPPEHVEFLSRVTSQALFYAGPDALRHKLILVDEAQGSSEADYSIRTLQSKGLLRLMVPSKGGAAEPFVVHGPISLMSGTTSSDLNPENLSRCLELTLDDSPEQTKRIQVAQARAWAGERSTAPDVQVWQDAQRVLERLEVVIPYAPQLRFPARTTADRRGSAKLLGLIAAHAFLHQHQRERDLQRRIVAAVADYAVVHALLAPTIAGDLDGLPPRAARAYRVLLEADGPLDRRSVAESCGWSYNTAKKALAELVAQELAVVADAGPPARYRVLTRSVLGSRASLIAPSELV